MNIGDYVKVVRFTKYITEENAELLLGNIFPVVNQVSDVEFEVMTRKGRRSVFIDEVEILISESTYLDKVDELETEIQRLQERIADLEEENNQLSQDLMSIAGGF